MRLNAFWEKVSTHVSLRSPHRLTRAETLYSEKPDCSYFKLICMGK